MERELAQVIERGIAGAEVVERQADAEIVELLHGRERAVIVLEQQTFGDLEFEPLRRQSRLRQRGDHLQGETAVAELHRRQVDGDLDAVRPTRRLGAGAVQGPVADRDDLPGFLGDRDEHRRRHFAAGRMRPAQQRLAGRHAAGAQIDQRLEIERELVQGQRVAQVEFERAALLHRRLHVSGEEAVAAAAAILGGVERHVGLLQQLVGIDAVDRRHGDADRGADVDAMTVDFERLLERARQPLGQPFGVLAAFGHGLQHHELVAAEARDHVARLDDGAEPVRHFLEQLVADGMAERVVDRLEAVEIDQVDGDAVLGLVRFLEHPGDAFAELGAIGEPGQFVEFGEMRDAFLRALAFGDVLADRDRADLAAFAEEAPLVPGHGLDLAVLALDAGFEALDFGAIIKDGAHAPPDVPAIRLVRVQPGPDRVAADHLLAPVAADLLGGLVPHRDPRVGVQHVDPDVGVVDDALAELVEQVQVIALLALTQQLGRLAAQQPVEHGI